MTRKRGHRLKMRRGPLKAPESFRRADHGQRTRTQKWQQTGITGRNLRNMRDFELMIEQLKRQREDIEKQMLANDQRVQETGKIFDRIRRLKERVQTSLIPAGPPKE